MNFYFTTWIYFFFHVLPNKTFRIAIKKVQNSELVSCCVVTKILPHCSRHGQRSEDESVSQLLGQPKVELCSRVHAKRASNFSVLKLLIINSTRPTSESVLSYAGPSATRLCPPKKKVRENESFRSAKSDFTIRWAWISSRKMLRLRQKICMLLVNVIRHTIDRRKIARWCVGGTYTMTRWKTRIFI